MKQGKQQLSQLMHTVQMGQIHIRSVLDTAMTPALRSALEDQLQEFAAIESEAWGIAFQRGWELREKDPAMEFLTDRRNRLRLIGRDTDSRIAGLLIRENTDGMIRCLRQLHRMPQEDLRLQILEQKLLDCETANIRSMQGFL